MRFRKTKSALILGCGPAGLFAAHAFVEAGWKVAILSKKRRSEMYGAQYLHQPIPGLTKSEPIVMRYILRGGTADDYQSKVYGPMPMGEGFQVSPSSLSGQHPAWDIREAYWAAWDRYAELITDVPKISAQSLVEGVDFDAYDYTLSSIPAPDICLGGHFFRSQQVWAIGDAPERGVFCPVNVPAGQVVCDASPDTSWYRASHVFGYKSAEWPQHRKPPIENVVSIVKPVDNTCLCWPWKRSRLVRIGRYGTWNKRELSHNAYDVARTLAHGNLPR